jgi:hypothetical protein
MEKGKVKQVMFSKLKQGDIVYSKTFGKGRITDIVQFDNFPIKWRSDKGINVTFRFNGFNSWLSEESDLYLKDEE